MGRPHWLPTANWGAGCKRHPHPRATESGCLPGTLRHVCVTLAGARLDAGTLTASITTRRRPCPKAALPMHSQDTLQHPSGSCAQVYYRAGKQVCSGKCTQRRIFSLALLRDVCCLRCQVPSLPPGAALATNPTGRCTEQGLQTRSVTWGNFILFSSACREMGWHKPPTLQLLPSLESRSTRGPTLLSSVLSPCRFIPAEALFCANKSLHCPRAAASSKPPPSPGLPMALQPVYPDFNRQLQLLQHRRVSRNSHQ